MSVNTDEALDLFELFSTSRESEEDGVWVELNAKTAFKIRAYSAKAVTDMRDKEMKPYANLTRAGLEIPKEKNDEIGTKIIANAILADWRGVVIEGEEVKYSGAAAVALLKKLPKLAGFIASASMDAANFREELREENGKNS